jgi:hypothetical protein
MKKHSTSDSDKKPNAWVVKSSDRGRKSIKKGNKIYFNDGDNFEIELFNPLKISVLADIKVNNTSVCKSGLVLRPGERFYLDCFIDDKKKFVFKTYSVENTDESKEAISNNGNIEVFFYKEETVSLNNCSERFRPVIQRYYNPYYSPYPYYPYYYSTIGTPGIFNTQTMGSSAIGICNTTLGASYTTGISSASTLTSTNLNNVTTNYSSSTGSLSTSGNTTLTSSIETGRVEKGDKSNANFTEVDMDFDKYHISNVIYQLLPNSQKPIETKEVKEIKSFCSNCGIKNGKTNFCPGCGQKL